MPRVDGEVDEIADLEQQLEIAEYEALMAVSGPYEQHTRRKVERLKRQIARLQHRGKGLIIAIDDDHPDFIHLD
jgi:hypothetical protein